MVTKYDVFELMYNKGAVKPKEILHDLNKTNYNLIYKILLELKKEKLATKSKYGFEIIRNEKTSTLYGLIMYSIKNKINYNILIDKNITRFIQKALTKKQFKINHFNINPKTFAKYTEFLYRHGLLLLICKKPITAYIPFNTFLKDLVEYFGYKINKIKLPNTNYLPQIENELNRFKKLFKKNERKYQLIIKELKIKFVQHSLSIEGNPITLPDTIKIIKDKVYPKDYDRNSVIDVENYKKALDLMINDAEHGKNLTKQSILNYHFIAMSQYKDYAGVIRKFSARIKRNPNFKICHHKNIEKELDILIKTYNTFNSKKHSLKEVLLFAPFFHNQFQYIHPFLDGNSRTTRLITFHLLRSNNIPILDIPLGLLEPYIQATKGHSKRKDSELNSILQQIILYNLKDINQKLT